VILWKVVDDHTGQVYASGLLNYEANMIAMGWTQDGYPCSVVPDK